jgi:hypothetical protein
MENQEDLSPSLSDYEYYINNNLYAKPSKIKFNSIFNLVIILYTIYFKNI